ncbi:MAG: riboflavin biosynthesis protein RibF [Anaerolineae bacterium]|nr:riboflavin biosynthesis protein RibF [Phycisphaerae bacterium]
MNIHEGLDGFRELPRGSVLSIGNFDGVHRGHLRIVELGRELRAQCDGRLALATFEPHPLTVLRPEKAPPRLTPPALKRSLLAAIGVDDLVVLPPSREILDLSAEDFWTILREEVQPAHIIEGDSFNFGKDRRGTIDSLRDWTRGTSVELHIVDSVQVALLDMQLVDVNSSLIRFLVEQGRMRDAAICLGRPYTIEGTVVEGNKRGRTIDVPTANIDALEQVVPADGVYAGRCMVDHTTYPTAISIGTLPTFDGKQRQIEAHLVGFDGDLYGRKISVDVIDWIRDQRKFDGIESLKSQLARDIVESRERSRLDPSRMIVSKD